MGIPALSGARPGRGGEGGCPRKRRARQSPAPGRCVLHPVLHQPALGFCTLEKLDDGGGSGAGTTRSPQAPALTSVTLDTRLHLWCLSLPSWKWG